MTHELTMSRNEFSLGTLPLVGSTTSRRPRASRAGGHRPTNEPFRIAYALARCFPVVGTGVDPVTSRFSGARSTN
jgi:hypothetical protein